MRTAMPRETLATNLALASATDVLLRVGAAVAPDDVA